jgi:hypothetical protein
MLVLTTHQQRQSVPKAVPGAQQGANRAARLEGTGTHSQFDDCGFEPEQTLKPSGIVPRTPVCNE